MHRVCLYTHQSLLSLESSGEVLSVRRDTYIYIVHHRRASPSPKAIQWKMQSSISNIVRRPRDRADTLEASKRRSGKNSSSFLSGSSFPLTAFRSLGG